MLIQFDHIIAMIIAGTLVMLIMMTQLSTRDAQVEAVTYYAGRANMMNLIEMLEHDFRNLGAGVDPADPMILNYRWDAGGRFIEFLTLADTSLSAATDSIKYVLVPSKTVDAVLDDSLQTIQCYELQRHWYDGAAYVVSGTSMDTMLDVEIELFQDSGIPPGGDLNTSRTIKVRLTAMSPMGAGDVVQRYRWETTFQPFSLALKDS